MSRAFIGRRIFSFNRRNNMSYVMALQSAGVRVNVSSSSSQTNTSYSDYLLNY